MRNNNFESDSGFIKVDKVTVEDVLSDDYDEKHDMGDGSFGKRVGKELYIEKNIYDSLADIEIKYQEIYHAIRTTIHFSLGYSEAMKNRVIGV